MKRFILASNSKRREDILSRFLKFEKIPSNIFENKDHKDPKILTMALSYEKGYDVAKNNEDAIVISADTVCFFNDKIIGKPKNREDAKNIILSFSNATHKVYTGFSIISIDENIKYTDYEVTDVKFKNLDEDFIDSYLDTLDFYDKAGAYGIQDQGALLVEYIIGDYENVVGLPISKISNVLNKLFNINIFRR